MSMNIFKIERLKNSTHVGVGETLLIGKIFIWATRMWNTQNLEKISKASKETPQKLKKKKEMKMKA